MIVLLILALVAVYFGVIRDSLMVKDRGHDSACIAKAALQVFFSICDRWDLSVEQEIKLLGSPTENEFSIWKENSTDIELGKVTLVRISHLMCIYHNLRTLLPDEEAANTWIKRENSGALFSGDSALNYLLNGDVFELKKLHQYLDNECL